jgi:hypothetical protein
MKKKTCKKKKKETKAKKKETKAKKKRKKKKSRVSVFNYLTLPKSFRPLLESPYVSFPS